MSHLIDTITKHVVEDGDCWNWTGALQSCGATPTMNYKRKVGAVRRFILLERGPAPAGRPIATYTCGNPLCVHPEHTDWSKRKAVQQRTTQEQGHQNVAVRNKKIADNARQRGKLTLELAEQVREAEGFQHEIAVRFGISQATVSSIKLGKTWRSYTNNPFAGLGARP
jgi:predicted XRE-type DNA-binding protein